MLVIRKCLFRSSKGVGDEKHKYYDIPSFPADEDEDEDIDFPLIFIDPLGLHAPPEEAHLQPISEAENGEDHSEIEIEFHTEERETLAEEEEPLPAQTQVEEPPSHETIVEAPQPEETPVEEPELQDQSALFGLHAPDRSSLYTCTEILGSEICENMVKEMSEAVTEWSWSRKRQKQKAVDVEMLANRGFPPPIPRYMGRPCQFMNIQRSNGRITMSLVKMDRQPELMEIEREDGQVIKMQLMTYIEYAARKDVDAEASASTSTSTSQQAVVEKTTCDDEEEELELELVTDNKLDSGGRPQKKCLALAA